MSPNSNIPFALVNPRQLRRRLGQNQQEFWSRIGVTQSGGSRYESGRSMPSPVQELARLHHVLGIDTRLITAKNAALIRAVLENGMQVTGHGDSAD